MDVSTKIRSIVKIAALAIIVIFFIPTFCVSCGSYAEVKFSAFDAAVDRIDNKLYEEIETTPTEEDEAEIKASPILFVIVILAIIIFRVNNTRPLTSMSCAAGCLAVMLLMKHRVEKFIGGSEYAAFVINMETTFAYKIHVILCIGIIGLLLFERYLLGTPERKKQISEATARVWQGVKNLDKPAGASMPSQKEINTASKTGIGRVDTHVQGNDRYSDPVYNAQFWECSCGARNTLSSRYCCTCYKNRPKC